MALLPRKIPVVAAEENGAHAVPSSVAAVSERMARTSDKQDDERSCSSLVRDQVEDAEDDLNLRGDCAARLHAVKAIVESGLRHGQ